MIKHSVVFTLSYPSGSSEEADFFKAALELAKIPGVEKFECLKQISKKNTYDFGLSMEFATQEVYDRYNQHPDHVEFIERHWIPSVTNFMEIDYEPMPSL